MNLIHGEQNRINLNSSFFSDFASTGVLYVDKTKFVEHVCAIPEEQVMLITRPRRMGKSLNLDTLCTFLDCTKDTGYLFKDLYIENSAVWQKLNKYPVIYLDFKDLTLENYRQRFRDMVRKLLIKYIPLEHFDDIIKRYYTIEDFSTTILYDFPEALYNYYGVNPYIIIDEYDNLFMNSAGSPGFEDFREWLRNILSPALKGNRFLEKAVLTGVNRIAQGSLFSGLNNLLVYDVFTKSKFDTDFGLTEEEVTELIPGIEERKKVKEWYNGFKVGGYELYNIYSVMSYLTSREFANYWGMSGIMSLLGKLMSKNDYRAINQILEEGSGIFPVQSRLSAEDILANNSTSVFWGIAVQTGYLAYKSSKITGLEYLCELCIPNLELRGIWKWFILQHIFKGSGYSIEEALDNIQDITIFAELLENFLITKLSYYDLHKENYENNYHNLLLGMFSFRGFETISNREAGLGRYDLLVKLPKHYIIFELKIAKEESLMETAVNDALRQINDKRYWAGLEGKIPIYKVGIAFCKKKCIIKSVLHDGWNDEG
ncbi:MAG: ATP-binding protein [Clostridiales bacterium]|jgi:hypothetical protein|nr:ATP-binding protein [Clostridiales bacterium]